MARIVVTESDLLDALATASTAPEDARTVQQMSDETGLDIRRIRQALHALQREGRLAVHRVPAIGLDGRQYHAPAYTISPKAKPATKRKRRAA